MVILSQPQRPTPSLSKSIGCGNQYIYNRLLLFEWFWVIIIFFFKWLFTNADLSQAWRWLEEEFEVAPKRYEDENFG